MHSFLLSLHWIPYEKGPENWTASISLYKRLFSTTDATTTTALAVSDGRVLHHIVLYRALYNRAFLNDWSFLSCVFCIAGVMSAGSLPLPRRISHINDNDLLTKLTIQLWSISFSRTWMKRSLVFVKYLYLFRTIIRGIRSYSTLTESVYERTCGCVTLHVVSSFWSYLCMFRYQQQKECYRSYWRYIVVIHRLLVSF